MQEALARIRAMLDRLEAMELPEAAEPYTVPDVRLNISIYGIAKKSDALIVAEQISEVIGDRVDDMTDRDWFEVSRHVCVHYSEIPVCECCGRES